ncbi:MAG: sigma factor-like helix-turn-helix DNA-binding protein [bacterium]|nr:sigma factor-like helix-turn-helix DNA-binding protein [bacterium]
MTFPYHSICLDLISPLKSRTREILSKRFGLEQETPKTLEAIGQEQGITRERVRQIVQEGVRITQESVQKESAISLQEVYTHFSETLERVGYLKREDLFVETLNASSTESHVIFLLSLHKEFFKCKETDELYSFWTNRQEVPEKIPVVVEEIFKFMKERKVAVELEEIKQVYKRVIRERHLSSHETISSVLEVTKVFAQGHDGRWGLREWPEVNPRGIREKAHIALKHTGRPLHFLQVTRLIEDMQESWGKSNRRVLPQTVHNELIKDARFVLVGRGMYGLVEWGYRPGTVKDVMAAIIGENGGKIARDEIIKKTLEQRSVKESTILLNLQDRGLFARDEKGMYDIRRD